MKVRKLKLKKFSHKVAQRIKYHWCPEFDVLDYIKTDQDVEAVINLAVEEINASGCHAFAQKELNVLYKTLKRILFNDKNISGILRFSNSNLKLRILFKDEKVMLVVKENNRYIVKW